MSDDDKPDDEPAVDKRFCWRDIISTVPTIL